MTYLIILWLIAAVGTWLWALKLRPIPTLKYPIGSVMSCLLGWPLVLIILDDKEN
jgi:hypothetical protein